MSEENERELTREELRAQLEAEFNLQNKTTSAQEVSLPDGQPVSTDEEDLDQPLAVIEEAPSVNLPAHDAADHLPIKQTWQIILMGIFYLAFGFLLVGLSASLIFTTEKVNLFGIVFIIFFLLGGLAALYSAVEEFRHLKDSRRLDQDGIEFKAKIAETWEDNYEDGGILVRKKVQHILYLYNDDKNYAKHAINRSLSKALQAGGWMTIEYLPDEPEIFRLKVNL